MNKNLNQKQDFFAEHLNDFAKKNDTVLKALAGNREAIEELEQSSIDKDTPK